MHPMSIARRATATSASPRRPFAIRRRFVGLLGACTMFASAWIVGLAEPAIAADGSEPDFNAQVRPLLEQRCQGCHSAELQSGSVDFSAFVDRAAAFQRYDIWKKVVEQVRTGAMPPAGEGPLSAEERDLLLRWIRTAFDTRSRPDPGPALVRQLTRDEYSQTIRDLLRFYIDAAGEAGIPRENVVGGYANRAGAQVLENSLVERYFTAADIVLERLFTDGGAAGARRALLPPDLVMQEPPAVAVRQSLQGFLRRAFRRPVEPEEVERYASLADAALAEGETLESALRRAMKPALVSPHFLLRLEGSDDEVAEHRLAVRVDDHALAVRLSYFLWGTMPDDALYAAAERGELSQPEEFERQVRRMLAHDKASSLTRHFLSVWLQLPHLQKALPSQNHFPTFTRSLRDAMERETTMFCDHLRTADRSVLELLDADYTFVNAELARHYGLPPVTGDGFERRPLRPEDHRGGVPGMAAILTMTSHTDRTKPTARGKWILDVLLGSPPPPPPANAGNFAPPDKDRPEPTSFREKLNQHAADPNCVGCHKRIDPLGFALENFDAIGGWRETLGGAPIDNRGTLPGVGEFEGVQGLRQVLRSKRDQFLRNLAEQTLSYALGREIGYYDEPAIDEIVAALERDDARFSTLIVAVAKSFPFQHRRSE